MKKQIGRSMIEMLGVLAVVGVLSVGALSMYRTALMRYRLGKTQEWFDHVRFIIADACEVGHKDGCSIRNQSSSGYAKKQAYACSMGGKDICTNGKLKTPFKEQSVLLYQDYTYNLRIYLNKLDKKACEAIIDYDWNDLYRIANYTGWTPAEEVKSGNKYLTQAQKDQLKAACPFPTYMVLYFNLQD